MKDWITELCPEIAEWQAELIAEECEKRVKAAEAALTEKQEPSGWLDEQTGDYSRVNRLGWSALYLHPAPVNQRIKELEDELMEQARVNGMGGEREAALMARVDRLEQALSLLKVAIQTGHPEYDERDWIDMIDTAMQAVRRD